ncbi:hypothetical protein J3A83DRAFT_4372798 [Scleroderma citrinum]
MTDAHGSYLTPVAVSPVLDTADIAAPATGVIKAKLHSLWENPNTQYWKEVVHVVWEQLPSAPGSVATNTGSTPPTTPSSTGLASSNNIARIDALEAEVLVLKKELVQEHYPLAQGLMGPIQHTTTPQPAPMPPSAITPAMVTSLGYTWQVDLALTTMVEEVPSHPSTLLNNMSEVQQQPPAPASIEDAPTHTDGATAPDIPLVLVTPAIIVSALDDAILTGSGEDNGANDMHVD